jgi:hypothetical protein
MKKLMKVNHIVAFVLGLISIAGIVLTNTFFIMLRSRIINNVDVPAFLDSISVPTAAVYMVFFIFHLSALLAIILQLKFFKRDNFLRAFLFFTGIISLLMLLGDSALMSDISKEYIFGLPDEFFVLFASQAVHFIFYVLTIILLSVTWKYLKEEEEVVVKDESIFINAQYIGILSGISGLVLVALFSIFYTLIYSVPLWVIKAGIIVMALLAIVPYGLIVIYWLILKAKVKVNEWYDEKQYQDIAKATLITLPSSLLFMGVIFILQYTISRFEILNFIWFPLFFFFTLLMFSCITLFLNKRDLA